MFLALSCRSCWWWWMWICSTSLWNSSPAVSQLINSAALFYRRCQFLSAIQNESNLATMSPLPSIMFSLSKRSVHGFTLGSLHAYPHIRSHPKRLLLSLVFYRSFLEVSRHWVIYLMLARAAVDWWTSFVGQKSLPSVLHHTHMIL